MQVKSPISDNEWSIFLNPDGVAAKQVPEDRPTEAWVTDRIWNNFTKLERICSGIAESFVKYLEDWRIFIENDKSTLGRPLPNEWDTRVDPLRRLVILRSICSEKVIYDELLDFIKKQLDATFLEPLTFSIEKIYSSASSTSPVLFILTDRGIDPTNSLLHFAHAQGMRDRFHIISLKNFPVSKIYFLLISILFILN